MAVEPDLWIDGQPASLADLRSAALSTYGAVTSFAVEGGAVRGLDLHVERLDVSARKLFGRAICAKTIHDNLRHSLNGRRDAWVRISLFSRDISPRNAGWIGVPSALMAVSQPAAPMRDGLRLKSLFLARYLPELKHAGNFDVIHARRTAILDGYDDALLMGQGGAIHEGSLWNIGFVRDGQIIWPEGPSLNGIAQQLIAQNIATDRAAVTLKDLSKYDAAFACNSATPAAFIASIDDHIFDCDAGAVSFVADAWRLAAPQPV